MLVCGIDVGARTAKAVLMVDGELAGHSVIRSGPGSAVAALEAALATTTLRREDILRGVNDSIVSRIAATSRRVGIAPDLVLTGGVARNAGIVQALREQLEMDIAVPEHPEIAGALGAALLAREPAGAA